MSKSTGCRDKNGREIFVGDLLRTYHYTDYRRKYGKQYMYHIIIWNEDKQRAEAVPVESFASPATRGGFWVHSALVVDCEIIAGAAQDGAMCWYERPKQKGTVTK